MSGRLIGSLLGIGVGPGDPELITLKAMRALAQADLVVHFAKNGSASHARTIAASHLRAGVEELPLLYPLTTEAPRHGCVYRDALRAFYDAAAATLAAQLDAGRAVAVICEGDPLFYGSYMHLHVRLAPRYPTQVIAGRHRHVRLLVGGRGADRARRRRADGAARDPAGARAGAAPERRRRRRGDEARPPFAEDAGARWRAPAGSNAPSMWSAARRKPR